jgi:hypothetical protein
MLFAHRLVRADQLGAEAALLSFNCDSDRGPRRLQPGIRVSPASDPTFEKGRGQGAAQTGNVRKADLAKLS